MRGANAVSVRALAESVLENPAPSADRAPVRPRAARGAAWSDLGPRIASVLVLAPVALVCLWVGGAAWDALILAAVTGLALEWVALCRSLGRVRAVPAMLGGLPYIVPAAAALIWLRHDPVAGRPAMLFLVLVVWATDIGAYATGRLCGGPRLAPTISPGKTWSGALGGLVAALLAGLLLASVFGAAPWHGALAAGLLSVAAQAGDLMESAIKRGFGVKDSGNLIPGHGGLLDRLDAMLIASPVAAGLAMLAGHGVVFFG